MQSASHLIAAPSDRFKSLASETPQACHEDVVCVSPQNEALARVARSVAKLVFTENGVTYLCSGTLINDGDPASQVPYVYTAAHCIGSQAAAATLNTFWFFDAATCGGKTTTEYRHLIGGASLLQSDPLSDVTLLRLADRAPEGAWFSGWDPDPLPHGTPLIGLHHPLGDLKKIAIGQALGPTSASGGASYATAAWLAGTTERGSSGSGIFTLSGSEYLLRGGLRGGSASCASTGRVDNPANRDYYSRLDLQAPALRTWLDADVAPLEDFTDMWFDPEEPGWGMAIVQHDDGKAFVTLYAYDAEGRPTWLVMPDPSWKRAAALEGTIYRTRGPAFETPYARERFVITAAGSAQIAFGFAGRATLTVTLDGRTIVKNVRRQPL